MGKVEFLEENEFKSDLENRSRKYKGLIGLVIKLGLAKDESGANKVLIIVAILAFVLTVFVLINSNPQGPPAPSSQDMIPAEF